MTSETGQNTLSGAAAITDSNNNLQVFYRGENSQLLYITSFDGGETWTSMQSVGKAIYTSVGPWVTMRNDKLYVFYKSNASDHLLFEVL